METINNIDECGCECGGGCVFKKGVAVIQEPRGSDEIVRLVEVNECEKCEKIKTLVK